MKKIIINGFFYTKRIDGLYRYSSEILNELDKIVPKDKYEILLPSYADTTPNFNNLKIVKYGNVKGRMWEQISFYHYIKKNNAISICLGNTVPLLRPGIVCVHDLLYKVNKRYFRSFHGKIAVFWSCLNYWRIAKSECKIITVSLYSKQQIMELYKVVPERITVIGNAWQHIIKVDKDDSIFDRNKELAKGEYFLTLGSLSEYKNLKWVIEMAKNNPDWTFAIAGGAVKSSNEILHINEIKNIILLGYVSDNEIVSLMENCKAFLFPSKFEGFGIPPLEALALGDTSIVSNSTCLPEIYENAVHYINPDNYDVNIGQILCEKIDSSDTVLKKYSWEKSAKKLYSLIQQEENI